MKKSLTLFALSLAFTFNAYANTIDDNQDPNGVGISTFLGGYGTLLKINFLKGIYYVNIPEGYLPLVASSDANSKTVISFPKGQDATHYTEAITVDIFKKARPGENYLDKKAFNEWLVDEAKMKCPLGYSALVSDVHKDGPDPKAIGAFLCNYLDENKVNTKQARFIAEKQLNDTYYMVTASVKKPSSSVKNNEDTNKLLTQAADLLRETFPLSACQNSEKSKECIQKFRKKTQDI